METKSELSLAELERQVKRLRERVEEMHEEFQRVTAQENSSEGNLALLHNMAKALGINLNGTVNEST